MTSINLYRTGKYIKDELIKYRYHSTHKKFAHLALRAIETQQGPIGRRIKKMSREYAQEVLGSSEYTPWLNVYSAVRGSFYNGWIPENYYGLIVSPLKNGKLGKITNIKTFSNRILKTQALPDAAYVIDGKAYSREFTKILEHELTNILFKENNIIFYKPDGSSQGKGLSIIRKEDFKRSRVEDYMDGVFQYPIIQNEFFDGIVSKSTATIRITTAKNKEGEIEVIAAYLRVGREKDEIVRSVSQVRIPLDKKTGTLDDFGYMPDWRKTEKHPDTGFLFSGKTIPFFLNAAKSCKALHESCPHLSCIGWDVSIDRDNKVKIMEWNAQYNAIGFSEATSGPCFLNMGWESLWRI